LPGLSALGGTNSLVAVDALEEFRIATSPYAPEYGRMPGGQVSLITRSGTNQWHGAVSEYYRNGDLDATDYFTERAGLPKPDLDQHDFGSAVGGPIRRDRLFVFGTYEALRVRQPRSGIAAVPSLEARQEAPPDLQPFLNAYPLPTGAEFGDGTAEYAASYSDRGRLDAASVRIDATPTAGLRVFGRYSDAPSSTTQRGEEESALSVRGFVKARSQTLTGGLTHGVGSRATHDLRANWSRSTGRTHFELDGFGGARAPTDAELFPTYPEGTTHSMVFRVQGLPSLTAGDTASTP
jgi:hypothetical protein